MKRIILYALVCAAFISCMTSCGNSRDAKEPEEETEMITDNTEPMYDIVTTMGTIRIKLYSKTPKHKANFIKLVNDHFYDGILFHRVINGFMIQAGDPFTKDPEKAAQYGTGGPGYTVPAEFVNEYYHKKGALAAARLGDKANPAKASSGSQFYLVQDEMNCLQLDGQYTIFGETVEGLDVIDKIAAVETDNRDRPLEDIRIISITKVVENNGEVSHNNAE